MIDQDKMRALAHQLRAWNWLNDPLPNQAADAIDLLLAEVEAAAADTARLEFLIDQQVWVQWTVRDGSIRQCQVYDQDEDENYHILSGDDRYFNTPRDAIDAALAQRQGEGS